MHFGLTDEQRLLRDSVRGFVAGLPSARTVLEGADAEDAAVWGRVAQEQGWSAIVIDEAHGGLDLGWMELAVVFEELGRALTPCSLLATTFATGPSSLCEDRSPWSARPPPCSPARFVTTCYTADQMPVTEMFSKQPVSPKRSVS